MTRIIISGSNGKMGRVVTGSVEKMNDCEIVTGIDKNPSGMEGFPVVDSFEDIGHDADVIIDFSNPSLLTSMLNFAKSKNIPCVICTTGFSTRQIDEIKEASNHIPIFYSGNMSLGINLMIELSKKAASILGGSFDVEIIEKHHNQKIDSPSGTALMIADAVTSVMNDEKSYVYDRHSYRKPREKSEIGIHSVRGGTIVGEHEIIFAGHDEVLKISHVAQSKEIFAVGSINAALFLLGKPAGLYEMSDIIAGA